MSRQERCDQIVALDDELLVGSIVLSEWCAFVVREADITYIKGAFLASILTAVCGIETYLRAEYAEGNKDRLVELIETSSLLDELKSDLQALRKYRNKWVHIENPADDHFVLEFSAEVERELESQAYFAARCLRRTIYESQGT